MSLYLGNSKVLVNLGSKSYKIEYFDSTEAAALVNNTEDELEENLTETNADIN